jgi:hypothetical protein
VGAGKLADADIGERRVAERERGGRKLVFRKPLDVAKIAELGECVRSAARRSASEAGALGDLAVAEQSFGRREARSTSRPRASAVTNLRSPLMAGRAPRAGAMSQDS